MTIYEAIDLFQHEMTNEIFHHVSDDTLQDTLINSLKEVSETVISTYEADKNKSEER